MGLTITTGGRWSAYNILLYCTGGPECAYLPAGSDHHHGSAGQHPLPLLLRVPRQQVWHGQRHHSRPPHVWGQVSPYPLKDTLTRDGNRLKKILLVRVYAAKLSICFLQQVT